MNIIREESKDTYNAEAGGVTVVVENEMLKEKIKKVR